MSLITWRKSEITGVVYGSTQEEIENDVQPSYSINGTTLLYSDYSDHYVKIRFASLEDAQTVARLVERGRLAQ